jgi:hypothetical protein
MRQQAAQSARESSSRLVHGVQTGRVRLEFQQPAVIQPSPLRHQVSASTVDAREPERVATCRHATGCPTLMTVLSASLATVLVATACTCSRLASGANGWRGDGR